MDANKQTINQIINSFTELQVPFYQRSYVWNEDNWERFLEDLRIITQTAEPYFLGSIIAKKGRPNRGSSFTLSSTLVDGQQRITTFLIFMKVLGLKIANGGTLFSTHFMADNVDIALKLGKNDKDAFERVVKQDKPTAITDYGASSQIINAFNYFIDEIDPQQYDIKTIFRNVQFVYIALDENDDEQQIFDTINSLGVTLTTAELLKNYFFDRTNIKDYENKWAAVFEKDAAAKEYWDTEVGTGRNKRSMIDVFFDAYFQMFVYDKAYKVSIGDKLRFARLDTLAKSIQDFIKRYCHNDKDVMLKDLKGYADCFRDTFDPDWCNQKIPAAYGIERMNVVIFGLKNTTLIPYVLYIAKNITNQNELNKMYEVLESYIMRRTVASTSNKNYSNLFTSLIADKVSDAETLKEKLKANEKTTTYIPSDEEVRHGFHESKLYNVHTKGILYLLESSLRPANSAVALLGFNSYSLEHLIPKKWENHWQPPYLSDSDAKIRDEKLMTLGNLAIITPSLNASIRDSAWQDKLKENKGKPGLKICANGLVTMIDVLNKEAWNEHEIDARAEWLCDEALKIWRI